MKPMVSSCSVRALGRFTEEEEEEEEEEKELEKLLI